MTPKVLSYPDLNNFENKTSPKFRSYFFGMFTNKPSCQIYDMKK